eukprot:XP_001704524.1 Hypothetical protein GL50803_20983 [Giardia lamblia ATCC 50803]
MRGRHQGEQISEKCGILKPHNHRVPDVAVDDTVKGVLFGSVGGLQLVLYLYRTQRDRPTNRVLCLEDGLRNCGKVKDIVGRHGVRNLIPRNPINTHLNSFLNCWLK